MSEKQIKNEQWPVSLLISRIQDGLITKPKYQRKKKWSIKPTRSNTPNEQAYIEFLLERRNSVHAITFGQSTDGSRVCYSNIDGNNRLNAITHFMKKPFELFPNHLSSLVEFINEIKLPKDDQTKLVNIIRSLSYNQLLEFQYHRYFKENGETDWYNSSLKIHRDEFEPKIEQIQELFRVSLPSSRSKPFDDAVKINVNIFEGYDTDELCKTFEDINKYNSTLTETELLACQLHHENDFEISDSEMKAAIRKHTRLHYKAINEAEALGCFELTQREQLNAHDFIISFQRKCHDQFAFIEMPAVTGMTLFYKLYKVMFDTLDGTFTTQNVNQYISKITDACVTLQEVNRAIFTDQINNRLFNNSCQQKLNTLNKNKIAWLLCSIIGFHSRRADTAYVFKVVERCVLFHFMVKDLASKEVRETHQVYDGLAYRPCTRLAEQQARELLQKPDKLNRFREQNFVDLVRALYAEVHTPSMRRQENGALLNETRRKLKFFEKTLMFYYYKTKMPSSMLRDKFSIEHICPNSSVWDNMELDKDRTGNMVPTIAGQNSRRQNGHLRLYLKTAKGCAFYKFFDGILPSEAEYDGFMKHTPGSPPRVYDCQKYNDLCAKNETTYLKNFMGMIYEM